VPVEEKMTRKEFNRKTRVSSILSFLPWPSRKELSKAYNMYSGLHDEGLDVSLDFEGRQIYIKW
jgi:hypothetical protein